MKKFIIFVLVTSVAVVLLGFVLREASPQSMSALIKNPKAATTAILNFISSLLYPAASLKPIKATSKKKKERIFTPKELKKYDGQPGNKGPYLALLGRVYNVKKGKKHYGPGGGYEFFSGRDASRAFVTGEFTEAGLVDDVTGLTGADYIGLDEWVKFYENDYKYVGKLIGRYYDKKGEATPYYYDVQQWITKAFRQKEDENQEKKMFPPCNSEWSSESGARLWCTTRSGGVERDWEGVPRKLYSPGQIKPRCACVKNFGPPSHDPKRIPHDNRGDLDHPNIKEYPGCKLDETSCTVKDN